MTPKTQADAMRALLAKAIEDWSGFDDPDCPINGADLVDWFAAFHKEASALLVKIDEDNKKEAHTMTLTLGLLLIALGPLTGFLVALIVEECH